MSFGKCTILIGLCLVWGLGGCGEDGNVASSAGAAGSAGAAATVEPVCADPAAPSDCACRHPPVTASCRDAWCVVPAGCYVIGEPEEVVHGPIDDRVEMTLSHDFSIQQHETTWADWKAAGLTPNITSEKLPPQEPPQLDTFENCPHASCPASNLTWFDALDYANRRSERAGLPPCYALADCTKTEGAITACKAVTLTTESVYLCRGYRLPTEVEWEVAARAGTLTAYYSGDSQATSLDWYAQDPALDPIAWYLYNTRPEPPPAVVTMSTHPVGLKEANGYGLYDMLGNVSELTSTPYDNVPREPGTDHGGGLEPLHWSRTAKGGGSFLPPDALRASPGMAMPTDWSSVARGVRLVQTRF